VFKTLELTRHPDARGVLTLLELAELPFQPERVFVVSQVPPGARRGGHGHLRQRQVLACVAGRVEVELRVPGDSSTAVALDAGEGLLVEPGVWSVQTYQTTDAVLMVLADGPYDPDELFHEPPDG
jgi:dTDP-4-dehydrorhamnose 3,5-epimerase-like enzyme